MYRVISDFRDLKNNNHLYRVGEEYPVLGYKPTKVRIEELVKGKNKYGKIFIEEIGDEKTSSSEDLDKENCTQTKENKADK